jgi:hypothetical protein
VSGRYTVAQLKDEIADRVQMVAPSIIRDQGNMVWYYLTTPRELIRLLLIADPINVINIIADWDKEPVTAQPTAIITYSLIIRSMKKIEKQVTGASQGQGMAEISVSSLGSIAIGLGKALVWPFFLAIAAALRITKVTADVTSWAG